MTVKLSEQLQIPFCVVQFRIPVFQNEVYNRKWKAAEKKYGLILLLCGFSFPSGRATGWRLQGRDTEGISAFVPKDAGK